MEKKEQLLGKLSKIAEGNKNKVRSTEQKLKQISDTQVRDANKKLKDKLGEVEVLKDMLKSANRQIKSKDIDIKRLLTRIEKIEKIADIQHRTNIRDGVTDHDNSISKRSNNGSISRAPYSGIIEEVEENLESTNHKMMNRQS
jgi:transposase